MSDDRPMTFVGPVPCDLCGRNVLCRPYPYGDRGDWNGPLVYVCNGCDPK